MPPQDTSWLLVDTSYLIFAKFFAGIGAVKRLGADNNCMDDERFVERFDDGFVRDLRRVMAAGGVTDYSRVVFCRDCSKSSVWRREKFPGYKGGRANNALFDKRIFTHVYGVLIPRLEGAHVVGAMHAEADDVIAVLSGLLTPSWVLTNDNDCIQLAGPRCRVVNLNLMDLTVRRRGIEPRRHLLNRILGGDRSDSIPGVISAGRTRGKTRQSEAEVLCALSEDEAARFWRNDQLMNLARVPYDIVHSVHEAAESCGLPVEPLSRLPLREVWGA